MRRNNNDEQLIPQISIQNQSMIEQYNQLQFSDEKQRDSPSSGSDKQIQLSPQKLKYLGVDKFPWSYGNKINQNSDTRQELIRKQQSNPIKQDYSHNSNYLNSKIDDHLYSRKKHRHSQQHLFKQHKSFNIDSFLNSQPVNYKHQRRQSNSKMDQRRQTHNRNALEQVLQQRTNSKKKQFQSNYMTKKQVNKIFEQRNKQIQQFIDKNRGNTYRYKDPVQNRSNINSSEESITLITLPQPPQSIYIQQHKKQQHNRHNKTYSLNRHNEPSNFQQEERKTSQMFQVRFQQARISFLDNFLPQTMKIGNNPYNFWKYANSKKNSYLRIV